MIDNKFLYFQTHDAFDEQLNGGNISQGSIAFIEDSSTIWTHGKEYDASGGEDNVIEQIKVNNVALTPDANRSVNITVPTQLSDLTSDSTHRVVTDAEKASWNAKADADDFEGVAYIGDAMAEGDDPTASFNAYSDTVWNKQQSLSDTQKQQILDNISAYSKEQVDEILATLEGGTAKVVSSLPTASADTQGDIYYVTSGLGNSLMGYVTVKSGSNYSWANVVNYNFSNVGNGYAYKGVATISTNPDTTFANVFYILGEAGTYVNMDSSVIHTSGIGIAIWNGSAWSYQNVPSSVVASAGASVSIDKNSDTDDSYTLIFLQNVEKYILTLTLQDSNENVFANADVTINGVEYATSALGVVSLELFSGSRTLVISIEGYETQSKSVNMDGNKSMTLTFNEYVSPDTIILTNAVNSDIPSKYVNAPLMNLVASALSGVEYSTDPVLLDENGNPAKYMTKQQAEYYTGDVYFYNKTGSTSVTSLDQLKFFSNASLVYRAFMNMSSATGKFTWCGYINSLSSVFAGTSLSPIDLSNAKSLTNPLVIDASGVKFPFIEPKNFAILSTNMNSFGYNAGASGELIMPKFGVHPSCASFTNWFRAATGVTKIVMGDIYFAGATSVGNSFFNCTNLTSFTATFHADLDIDINLGSPKFDAASVERWIDALKVYEKDSNTHTITFSATAKQNYNSVHEIVDATYTSALQEALANIGWTLG